MFMNGLTAQNSSVPPRAPRPLEAEGNPRMGTLFKRTEKKFAVSNKIHVAVCLRRDHPDE